MQQWGDSEIESHNIEMGKQGSQNVEMGDQGSILDMGDRDFDLDNPISDP